MPARQRSIKFPNVAPRGFVVLDTETTGTEGDIEEVDDRMASSVGSFSR